MVAFEFRKFPRAEAMEPICWVEMDGDGLAQLSTIDLYAPAAGKTVVIDPSANRTFETPYAASYNDMQVWWPSSNPIPVPFTLKLTDPGPGLGRVYTPTFIFHVGGSVGSVVTSMVPYCPGTRRPPFRIGSEVNWGIGLLVIV